MALRIVCPGCSVTFSVDERLAGRAARCKNCRTSITIPQVSAIPSSAHPGQSPRVVRPKLIPASASSSLTPLGTRRPDSWIDAVNSHVGLQPLSAEALPPVHPFLPPGLDDQPPSGPYNLVPPPSPLATDAITRPPASQLTVSYRHRVKTLIALFRWINQTAYLISVPFVMLFLFGVITQSHSLTALGVTVVLLLNAGRLVSGVANLVVIPFRDSPLQAILFLVPPFTFIYLFKNWQKLRNPIRRLIAPVATVGVIILTFAFDPWLRGNARPQSLAGELRKGVAAVKDIVREELEDNPTARSPAAVPPGARPPSTPADRLDPGANSP